MNSEYGIPEEQSWRADTYNLLANLFQAPPSSELLLVLAKLGQELDDSSASPIARAWKRVANGALNRDPESIGNEYHRLFIGMTRGEVLPYASWYLTGFLMEKPLAQIRGDLEELGIRRAESIREPEDHIAALFEVMALLIRNNDAREQLFFEKHIATWVSRLFQDIENDPGAFFYRAVANLARHFIDLERQLFEVGE